MINRADFRFPACELPASGDTFGTGDQVDVFVESIALGTYPRDFAKKHGDVLVEVTVESRGESTTWSFLRQNHRADDTFFDPTRDDPYVVRAIEVGPTGLRVTVRMAEVDKLQRLKKGLETLMGVADGGASLAGQLTRAAGGAAIARTSLGILGQLRSGLPDELLRGFFESGVNLDGPSGPGIDTLRTGTYTMRSEPKAPARHTGTTVALTIRKS